MKRVIYLAIVIFILPIAAFARGIEDSTWSDVGSGQITVSISSGNFVVNYPNLGCSGYWDVERRVAGRTYSFTERLTSGDKCTDGAKIRATLVTPGRMKIQIRGRGPGNFNGNIELQKSLGYASFIAPPNYGTVPRKLPTQEELRQIREEEARITEERRIQENRRIEAEKRVVAQQERQRRDEAESQRLYEKEDRIRRSKEYIDTVRVEKNISVIGDLSTQDSGAGITSFANTKLDYRIFVDDNFIISNNIPIFMLISADSVVSKSSGSDRRKSFFLKRKLDLCDGYYVILHPGNKYSYQRSAENSVSVRNTFEGYGGIWSGLTKQDWVGQNLDVEIDIMLASSEPDLVFQRRTRYDFCFFNSEERSLWRSYIEN